MATDLDPLPVFSHIGLNTTHTCALVFPSPVVAWQQDSGELISCTAAAGKKLLLVKAGKEQFRQTILRVNTEDGSHYHLVTRYTGEIARSLYTLDTLSGKQVQLKENAATPARVRKSYLPAHPRAGHRGLQLELSGSYIYQGQVFYQLDLFNNSPDSLDPFVVQSFYSKSGWSIWTDHRNQTELPVLSGRNDVYLEPFASKHLVLVLHSNAWYPGHELVIEATSISGKLLQRLAVPHLEMAQGAAC